MRGGPQFPSWEGTSAVGLAASDTKVSKPVLFVLKMTDFQAVHKQDSALSGLKAVPAPLHGNLAQA